MFNRTTKLVFALLIVGLGLLGSCGAGSGAAEQAVAARPTLIAVPRTLTVVQPTATPRQPTATVQITATALLATASPTPAPTERTVATTYVFPVRSKGKISYSKAHHDYPATDIFCPKGSTFVAVTNGVVDFISSEDTWKPAKDQPELRGGISVAIVGDDGVRYYGSHLSSIEPGIVAGVRVVAGQTLGYTGNSGNARSTPPHLHFGISRPTTPDDWQTRRGQISPYPYLKAWERGEPLAPQLEH